MIVRPSTRLGGVCGGDHSIVVVMFDYMSSSGVGHLACSMDSLGRELQTYIVVVDVVPVSPDINYRVTCGLKHVIHSYASFDLLTKHIAYIL